MKIKVPRKIKLGIYTYKIKFDPTLQLVNGNIGEHRPNKGEIVLTSYQSDTSKILTLNHEVLHHISSQYQLDLDEREIERLAHGFAEYMQSLGIELDWSEIKVN